MVKGDRSRNPYPFAGLALTTKVMMHWHPSRLKM